MTIGRIINGDKVLFIIATKKVVVKIDIMFKIILQTIHFHIKTHIIEIFED